MDNVIIQTKGLQKKYKSFTAVDDLNLSVYRGDIYGFLGPNGAGKSTTIRMLLSLITPSAGEIKILGKELQSNRTYILSRIGSIVEKPDFYKYLSAKKNLELFASLSGLNKPDARIKELIELVGLSGRENNKVSGYSHGMKQRLGIAQCLLPDPDLIILDEPTTGLDPQGIIDIRNLLLNLQKEKGKTILLSSHILSEIELISNRMIILNKGRSIVEGEVSQLLNSNELIVQVTVLDVRATQNLINQSEWKAKLDRVEENRFYFHLSQIEIPALNKFLTDAGCGVTGIESKRKLEDYFLKLIAN